MSRFQNDLVDLVPRLRRFAYALTGSRDAGDDLVQSACERALRRQDQFTLGTRLDSWMFRIMQNLWIDQRRRLRVRGTEVEPESLTLSDGGRGSRHVEDQMTLERVRAAVDTLPGDQRAVLVLVAIEGMNYREAAGVLDLPVGTVMSRLSRARDRLAGVLGIEAEERRGWVQ